MKAHWRMKMRCWALRIFRMIDKDEIPEFLKQLCRRKLTNDNEMLVSLEQLRKCADAITKRKFAEGNLTGKLP